MNLKNTIQLIGYLGEDPKQENKTNGKVATIMSLATHDYYFDNEGIKKTDTQWHKIVAFGKIANRLKTNLSKGDEVQVVGKLTYSDYGLKGLKKNAAAIFLKEILFMKSGNSSNNVQEEKDKEPVLQSA